jgi:hypothetical protein
MGGKWEFVSIQVGDGAGKDERTRKIVRKTAMKTFRRNQRLERVKDFMQKERDRDGHHDPKTLVGRSGKVPSSKASEVLGVYEAPKGLVGHHTQDDPGSSLEYSGISALPWPREIVSLDPFGSSPLGTCSTWHFLFTHCESYFHPQRVSGCSQRISSCI